MLSRLTESGVARRTRKNADTPRPYAALLSNLGILECGYCGRTVKVWNNSRIRKDGTKNNYYGCQSKNEKSKCQRARLVPQRFLEERVLTNFFSTLGELELLKEYWLKEQAGRGKEDLDTLDRIETEENEKKQRLVSAIAAGIIGFEDARIQLGRISENILEISRRRSAANIENVPPDWEALDFTREDYEFLDTDEKRQLLSAAICKILVYENYAIVEYKFPRLPNGDRTSRVKFGASDRRKRFRNGTEAVKLNA